MNIDSLSLIILIPYQDKGDIACFVVALITISLHVGADDSWHHITAGPPATAAPTCSNLEHFKHLYNLKGLDACEPHHIVWFHLNELSKINWQCRKNIIDVLSYRYGQGSMISQYCGCKSHDWTEKGVSQGSTPQRVLSGIPVECFSYKGCRDLKDLYEHDTCTVHEMVWRSLESCPTDIYVEGQPIECQSKIINKIAEIFNGSYEQYENDKCFCYPNFGLSNVPSECNNYSGFRRLQLYGLNQQSCDTHFGAWKYLATQPVRCQDWIINYMLDKTNDNFACDCRISGQDVFGRSIRKRDTSILPACEQNSPGWTVLHSTLQNDVCHSHWYVWRHLADTHRTCRTYLINEMFARFATMSPGSCVCDYKQLQPTNDTITTTKSTTKQSTTKTTIPITTSTSTTQSTTNPTTLMTSSATTTESTTHQFTSTASTTATTTKLMHSCFTCNGTSCASTGTSIPCSKGDDFCMTSIIDEIDNAKVKRVIERKCVSKQVCDIQDQSKDLFCAQLSQGSFGFPMTCRYCCVGFNCNAPPALKPAVSALYSTHFQ